ncbi:hypothetical protein PVAP13_7NG259117 [Panicum virgatum]|uniref:Uncharacterized protein n=1 Tax=Panicum virgatum TaxID=38727 RepID=A0A8T0Q8H1_PANVG|nr:hypothetical protein PVAP13_7NG259117 [Panicum virgatum]
MHRSVLELDRGRSSGQPQQCLAMGIPSHHDSSAYSHTPRKQLVKCSTECS